MHVHEGTFMQKVKNMHVFYLLGIKLALSCIIDCVFEILCKSIERGPSYGNYQPTMQ